MKFAFQAPFCLCTYHQEKYSKSPTRAFFNRYLRIKILAVPVVYITDSLADIRHDIFHEFWVASGVNHPFVTSRVPDHESLSIQAISWRNQSTWLVDVLRFRFFTAAVKIIPEGYQVLCQRSPYLYLGRNMDYDNEPNSQNVSIGAQLNDHGRIFNDIGCSLT